MIERDRFWMVQAIDCAKKAQIQGEVPVGALLVKNDEIIALGWNQSIQGCDPSLHAEMVAIRGAGKILNNYRLPNTTLYVTLEPCMMCAGLILHARISRLVFGAWDSKSGACSPLFDKLQIEGGVMATECKEILQNFFSERRKHAHSS